MNFSRTLLCCAVLLATTTLTADVLITRSGRQWRGTFRSFSADNQVLFESEGSIIRVPLADVKTLRLEAPDAKKQDPTSDGRASTNRPGDKHSRPGTNKPPVAPSPPESPPHSPPDSLPEPSHESSPESSPGKVSRDPAVPPRTQGGRPLAFQWLVPGLPQLQAGRTAAGFTYMGGFALFFAGSLFYYNELNRIVQATDSNPAYHIYLDRSPRGAYRSAVQSYEASLAGMTLVYSAHLFDLAYLSSPGAPTTLPSGRSAQAPGPFVAGSAVPPLRIGFRWRF